MGLYWNGLKYNFMEIIDMMLRKKDSNYIFNEVIFLSSFKSEILKINIFNMFFQFFKFDSPFFCK